MNNDVGKGCLAVIVFALLAWAALIGVAWGLGNLVAVFLNAVGA